MARLTIDTTDVPADLLIIIAGDRGPICARNARQGAESAAEGAVRGSAACPCIRYAAWDVVWDAARLTIDTTDAPADLLITIAGVKRPICRRNARQGADSAAVPASATCPCIRYAA